jgi:hypothetical protein
MPKRVWRITSHSSAATAAEAHDHLIGEDHRDGDRDQRLAQVLALVPAQQQLLHHEPHGAAGGGRERRGGPPPEAVLDQLQREIAAEQVQRAVGHVDHAHQPEHEREPARGDEVERGQAEPVERHDHELRAVAGRAEALAERLVGDPRHRERQQRDRQDSRRTPGKRSTSPHRRDGRRSTISGQRSSILDSR